MIEEKQALIGTSRLMMMFDAKDLQLKQWTVTDPQGFDTTVAVSNLDSDQRPDPNLFRIDYTDAIARRPLTAPASIDSHIRSSVRSVMPGLDRGHPSSSIALPKRGLPGQLARPSPGVTCPA